jgi:hypothetical protein
VQLRYSLLSLPKEGSTAEQCEDAAAYLPESRIAAVSDGASSAFESGRWAHLLTQEFVDRPPLGLSKAEILDWVGQVSAKWSASMSGSNLTVYEEAKIASEGSAATLVGVHFEEAGPQAGEGTWQCVALGDSCLFQVSEGGLAVAMPLTESGQFGQSTPLIYTQRELSERDMACLKTQDGDWRSGDTFLLMTDAIAAWFLRDVEHGGKPWDTLAELNPGSFGAFVAELRRRKRIRNDDVTVARLEPMTVSVPGQSQRRPRHGRPKTGVRTPVPVGGSAPAGPTRPPSGPTGSPGEAGSARPPSGPTRPPSGPVHSPAGPTRPPTGPTRPPGEAGSARPPSGRPPVRMRTADDLRTRRIFGGLVVALSLGLIAGIVIGWAAWHGSLSSPGPVITLTPSPAPSSTATPSPSPTLGGPPSAEAAIQDAAHQFVLAMVNFGGDLSEYESSLRSLSTPALAQSLPQTLGLGSLTSGSVDSKGRVISSTVDSVTDSAAVVYLIVDQEVATAPAFHGYRQILLIRLDMARSGTTWQASEIMFVNSAGQMLPQPASDTVPSPHSSVHPTSSRT